MAFDDGLVLGVDVPTPSKKNWKMKVVGGVVCGVAAGIMIGAVFTGNSPAGLDMASEPDALAAAASFTRPRLGGLRANTASAWTVNRPQISTEALPSHLVQNTLQTYGINASPLAQLAATSVALTRPDVSMKAAKEELISGWNLVDEKTKKNLLTVLDEVENKESLLAGVSAPMNYFDPLGFATTVTAGKLLFYREVELKHGRVAMLASLGILVGEQYHPLFGGDIDVPAIYAFQQTPLETFWYAVVAALAIPEVFSVQTFQDPTKGGEQWAIKEDHMPGDLGYDPLGLKPKNPAAFKDMQSKELNNGRLAMIATAGMIAQELVTGQKVFG